MGYLQHFSFFSFGYLKKIQPLSTTLDEHEGRIHLILTFQRFLFGKGGEKIEREKMLQIFPDKFLLDYK